MASNSTKTKTIAKNAVFLYIRMIIVTIITLFTARIVLRELGFEDYGLYNVVGGVVTLFAFLRSSMNSSTQRFLSFEMAKGDKENLRNTFSICFTSHVLIAAILLIIAETIGLWFLNTQIVIPAGREVAANWVYQFAVLSLCVNIISIPYSADIISNEEMGYFAFLGVLDAVLKLIIAYVIMRSPIDRLIFYGFLMMFISVIDLVLNWIYCHIKFTETHYKLYWNRESFKKTFSFSGWTIWGQLAIVGSNQGTNILVNMFFSVVANAAMGIGSQVNNAITGLVSNFQTAFKPQITKSYAENNYDYLNKLIIYASKISFFLLLVVSFPIVLNLDWILTLWLGNVPELAGEICTIYIFASLCNAISAPLWMSIFATGNIKSYQITISLFYLFELVIIYMFFVLGCTLVHGLFMKCVLNFAIIFVRIYYNYKEVKSFRAYLYITKVLCPLASIGVFAFMSAYYLSNALLDIYVQITVSIFLELLLIFFCYRFGLDSHEKSFVKQLKKMIK